MKRKLAIICLLLIMHTGSAQASNCMRYNHRRICPGASIADVLNLFGEPLYKTELGEVTGPLGSRKVELWIYEHELKRWELTIAFGRVMEITKIRLRRVE